MKTTRSTLRVRWAAGAAAVLLPLGLTACGSFGGGGEADKSDGALTVWQYYGDASTPTGGPLYDVLEAYDKQTEDVTIKIRFIPFDDFNRTLLQAAAADDLPDVALINAFDTQSMADAGVIQDLGARVDEWGEKDSYFPTSWKTTQAEGSTYGIPHVADAYAVYYNKKLLDAAGVKPPASWVEMEATAATLGKKGAFGLAVSGVEGAEGATGLVIRDLAGGGTVEKFDDAAGHHALTAFKTMVDSGALSEGYLTWNEEDAKNQFANEKAAMMINSATYISVLREENPDLEWGVALLPKDKTRLTFLSAENLTIGKGSGDADAAWSLITHLQEPGVLAKYLPARNKLAARNDVTGADDDPVRKVFTEQLEEAWAPDGKLAAHSNEVFTLLQEAQQAVVSGSGSPEEAAGSAQTSIDEVLGGS